MSIPVGIISIWFGSIVDIPNSWALCNGNNGTPDLTDCFIVGAGDSYDPGDTGGVENHDHDFTSDLHNHNLQTGGPVGITGGQANTVDNRTVTGTTDEKSNLPPFYALAFIMKL